MSLLRIARSRLPGWLVLTAGVTAGVLAAAVLVRTVDGAALADAVRQAGRDPVGLVVAGVGFGLAFVLRAVAWRRVLPTLTLGQALAAIHLALGANHLLPFRMGEPFRVLSVVRRTSIGAPAATASTVMLRAIDMVTVVAIGLAAAPAVYLGLIGWAAVAMLVVVGAAAVAAGWWLRSITSRRSEVRLPGPLAVGLSAAAWLAEAVLVWQVAGWAGLDLSWPEAVIVTTVAIAAQFAAIAPGGLGTYEAAAVAAYVGLGYEAEPALVAAVGAHGLKTGYSIVAGAIAVVTPAPSLLGRFRIAPAHRGDHSVDPTASPPPEGPVLLFMPAFNEEAAVGACVGRTPRSVAGRPVEVLVIDDGSTDATAERAAEAGAEVLRVTPNRGLGAAVRLGLATAVERGVAAVAFCDADGEYPPEQLEAMVAPILDGRADYVTGSRFLGHIEHMRPHRRLGNRLLTAALSIVARRRISDGQTGYRALSPRAAAAAEIIHDFNYAQVLTLDLLAKGYRHVEVPISYRFRTTGDSFIKLGPYLRRVVPAVYREVNTASS